MRHIEVRRGVFDIEVTVNVGADHSFGYFVCLQLFVVITRVWKFPGGNFLWKLPEESFWKVSRKLPLKIFTFWKVSGKFLGGREFIRLGVVTYVYPGGGTVVAPLDTIKSLQRAV